MSKIRAFTIIELSMVIISIGLLFSLVLGGKTLLENSKLNEIGVSLGYYSNSVKMFNQKYLGFPGDILGSKFWDCSDITGTCDGNYNGNIDEATSEAFLFWYHLSKSGLITEKYSGIIGPVLYSSGNNCPTGPLGGCFGAKLTSVFSISANYIEYGNINTLSGQTTDPILTPRQTSYILDKFDDKNTNSGKILVAGNAGACFSTSPTTSLNLRNNNVVCRILYNIEN